MRELILSLYSGSEDSERKVSSSSKVTGLSPVGDYIRFIYFWIKHQVRLFVLEWYGTSSRHSFRRRFLQQLSSNSESYKFSGLFNHEKYLRSLKIYLCVLRDYDEDELVLHEVEDRVVFNFECFDQFGWLLLVFYLFTNVLIKRLQSWFVWSVGDLQLHGVFQIVKDCVELDYWHGWSFNYWTGYMLFKLLKCLLKLILYLVYIISLAEFIQLFWDLILLLMNSKWTKLKD